MERERERADLCELARTEEFNQTLTEKTLFRWRQRRRRQGSSHLSYILILIFYTLPQRENLVETVEENSKTLLIK